jgi:UDP-N-acetylmuramoylalanine--D-glutamate ligase
MAKTLEEAVLLAHQTAKKGEVVLLSPACSSYDMFKDYKERGKVFKEAVRNLSTKMIVHGLRLIRILRGKSHSIICC